MRKKTIWLSLILVLLPLNTLFAQRTQEIDFTLKIIVDSAFVRVLPSRDSAPSASLFEDNIVIAFGRNADGTWFKVQRPNGGSVLGWMSREVATFSFDPALLPILDSKTGVTGPEPVVSTGVSAFFLANVRLRDEPSLDGAQIGSIPHSATLPVIERNADATWIKVNYNGYVGWVARFLTRITGDVMTLPTPPLPPPPFTVIIIPPEIQLAQVQRLRGYIAPRYDLAQALSNYWNAVYQGTILLCDPPEFLSAYYDYAFQDIVELPELQRYVPGLQTAVDDLNSSLSTLQTCGVYPEKTILTARAKAISAIDRFDAILDQLDNLEKNVIR